MILFTNGCSWTWGGGLGLDKPHQTTTREQLLWPTHLGKLLGADKVVNLAAGCGSSQRIVRTTYDWFLNEYRGEEIVAIIQWTEYCRYEYYVTDNPESDFANEPNKWARVKPGVLLSSAEADYFEAAIKKTEQRFSTYSDLEGMYLQIERFAALANLFAGLKVKYFYWAVPALLPLNSPKMYKDYISNKFNLLHHTSFDGQTLWQYERVSEMDQHPSRVGHQQLADIIYNEIKNRI